MKTVRNFLLVCLISAVGILIYGKGYKVQAYSYFEINVELGYNNQAKYGRYIPVEIEIYSEEDFEGTISIQRMSLDGSMQISTYPVSVSERESNVIKTWEPFFDKNNPEFVFILKDSAGEEVKRKNARVDALNGDYTELFVGVLDLNGIAKQLFNDVNLGEYSNITFPYIMTKTLPISPNQISGDIRYTLDCLDIIVLMDEAMRFMTEENIESLLSWVKSGKTLIVEKSSNISGRLLEFYDTAFSLKRDEDELRPGLWMFGVDYENGHIGFIMSDSEERNFYAFANNNKEIIVMVLCKACPLETINDIINYDMYYTNYDNSYAVQYMLNASLGKPIPDIIKFIVVIAVYIFLVGPALYLLLRRKNRAKYIMPIVLTLTVVFSYIIYNMGRDTRFTDMFLQYASIVDIGENAIEEKTYICANIPYKDIYYMRADSSYVIRPLLKSKNEVLKSDLGTDNQSYMEFVYTDEDVKVILQNRVPFSREYIEAGRISYDTDKWEIDSDITYYDGAFSGSITNRSNKNYSQAALIAYGKIILLGDIKIDETRSIDDAELITLPYYPNDAAKRITTLSYSEDDARYEEVNGKVSILEYVINRYFDDKNTRPVLIGFTDNRDDVFKLDDRYETLGFTMIYKELDINTSIGNLKYEPIDYTNVRNLDNNSKYDAYSNTTYGSWVRIQYNLSDAESILRIIFDQGNRAHISDDDYYEKFSGTTYFYNHTTLAYDEVDISKGYFYISELEDYLLVTDDDCYRLTVQYAVNTTEQYRYTETKLPYIAVVRRNVYAENTKP